MGKKFSSATAEESGYQFLKLRRNLFCRYGEPLAGKHDYQ